MAFSNPVSCFGSVPSAFITQMLAELAPLAGLLLLSPLSRRTNAIFVPSGASRHRHRYGPIVLEREVCQLHDVLEDVIPFTTKMSLSSGGAPGLVLMGSTVTISDAERWRDALAIRRPCVYPSSETSARCRPCSSEQVRAVEGLLLK
jgi:hypothetical protein